MNESPPIDGAALCEGFVDALAVHGAAIVTFGPDGQQSTIGASNAVASRVDSLQFELQEGPHWDVQAMGAIVLCPDLDAAPGHIWPVFSRSCLELGVAAIFSVPMKIGNALVGAVDLHHCEPRTLDAREIGIATYLATQIAATAVEIALRSATNALAGAEPSAPFLRREVHQATGMVQSQLKITTGDAFARLRAYAFATGVPIEQVAREVVERRLDFGALDD